MQRVSFKRLYDFIVVCALEEERTAFSSVHADDFSYGELFAKEGLDCRELTLGDFSGACVLQPRMGLVDASIITARALNAFDPTLVCMSGICGGFKDDAELGTLLISDITWEHQAGKHRGPDFEMRHYQEALSNDTRTILSQLIQSDPELRQCRVTPFEGPATGKAVILPSVSGSAVIANAALADSIRKQHGKVAGVDMEVFGLYRASALHGKPVKCFAAKTIVDFADEAKNDALQRAGSVLSARFVVSAIRAVLSTSVPN